MEGGSNIQQRRSSIENEENGDETHNKCFLMCCHPHGTFHRFIALIFMCFLGFGSYFCYDNPSALQDQIKGDLNITETQYSMLYSIYSWPNVILCFIGGFLIDRIFGIRLGTNLYMAITLCGQILFAMGVYFSKYWCMVVGRFIFGIGAESLAVAQNNYAVLWFKGKELNMVFGLQLCFARVGSAVNFRVMEPIYQWVHQKYVGPQGLGIVLFIAAGTCILSMLCALILGVLDKRAERITRRNQGVIGDVVRITDVKDFKATFWLVTAICISYYVAVFPFIAVAQDFFISKFHMEPKPADDLISTIYLISAGISPILGLAVDKMGKNVAWLLVATLITITSHSLLAFTMVNPYVGMVIMSIAFSTLSSSLWPLVSLIIPEYQLGTAYGVCQAVQNLGLALVNIFSGVIVDKLGYTALEIFYISSLMVALICIIILWMVDKYENGMLNMTPGNRLRRQQTLIVAEVLEREKLLSAEAPTTRDSNEFLASTDAEIRNSVTHT